MLRRLITIANHTSKRMAHTEPKNLIKPTSLPPQPLRMGFESTNNGSAVDAGGIVWEVKSDGSFVPPDPLVLDKTSVESIGRATIFEADICI